MVTPSFRGTLTPCLSPVSLAHRILILPSWTRTRRCGSRSSRTTPVTGSFTATCSSIRSRGCSLGSGSHDRDGPVTRGRRRADREGGEMQARGPKDGHYLPTLGPVRLGAGAAVPGGTWRSARRPAGMRRPAPARMAARSSRLSLSRGRRSRGRSPRVSLQCSRLMVLIWLPTGRRGRRRR